MRADPGCRKPFEWRTAQDVGPGDCLLATAENCEMLAPEPVCGKLHGVSGHGARATLCGLPTSSAGPMNLQSPTEPGPGPRPTAILSPGLPSTPAPLRAAITAAWVRDETEHVRELLAAARQPDADRQVIQATAADLVRRVRARAQDQGAIEAFMRQYDLGSEEGVLLMCVAEALLRIPDQDTADKLIRDKLGEADWKRHMGQSDSVLVNAR